MKNLCTNYEIIYFFRYMRLFEVTFFSIVSLSDSQIRAKVTWLDACCNGMPEENDDIQEVAWRIPSPPGIEDALKLAEFMYNKGCILSDKIDCNLSDVQAEINWEGTRFKRALKILLEIKAPMIDDGEQTDYFFLHL